MPEETDSLHTELAERVMRLYRKTFLDKLPAESRKSSVHTLLKYAGTWAGNDIETCLTKVISSRGEAHF